MREFRKKQKKFKKIMNTVTIITSVFIFLFYGFEPSLAKWIGSGATMAVMYVMYGFVIVSLSMLFLYSSKYAKSDKFLEGVEYELSDAGYYLTSRAENNIEDYAIAVTDDLTASGYSIKYGEVINELEFDAVCSKGREMFYIVKSSEIDKNDLIAYIDSAVYDITAVNIKRRCDAVVLFICDNAEDGAVSLSKMITALGKKEQIKVAPAVAEVSTGRVYFLGNKVSKCQQMTANFVMNCNVPIKDDYIVKEKLPFQSELEEHMKEFNIKDYKNGAFFAH